MFQCDQMFHKGIAILWSLTSSIPNQLYNTTIWATMLGGSHRHLFRCRGYCLPSFQLLCNACQSSLNSFMRQTNDPLTRAGILFQPIRGILFGFVFYLLRDVLFRRKNGWLIMWTTLIVIGILSAFAPAPSSIEGLIYTKVPLTKGRLGGLAEVLSQSFLLSAITYYWVNHPEKRWLTWVLGSLFLIALALLA